MGTQGVIDETSKIFYWAHVKKRRSQKPKAKIYEVLELEIWPFKKLQLVIFTKLESIHSIHGR